MSSPASETNKQPTGQQSTGRWQIKGRGIKVRKVAKNSALAACFLAIGTTGIGTWKLRSSLPVLTGEHRTAHVEQSIKLERDAMGVPTIHAQSREDAAYGLGYLHGQDRFFQMDLLRRMTAGRLSELVGKAAVGSDKRFRKHRFGQMAKEIYDDLSVDQKLLVDAYSKGVNEGLHRLEDEPFEYQVLQSVPEDWQPSDSFLVMLTMLCDLQPMDGTVEQGLTLLHEKVPEQVFKYLVRSGSRWDAAIDGSEMEMPEIPGEEIWSMRQASDESEGSTVRTELPTENFVWGSLAHQEDLEFRVGSNNWAVSAEFSSQLGEARLGEDQGQGVESKRAILASDMHLGLNVPTIWYRAVMHTPSVDGEQRRLVGVTLPGTPVLIEGSNGSVAWGFTNSYGDYGDLIELKMVTENSYATPSGVRELEKVTETFQYSGGSEEATFEWSVWGPVVEEREGRRFVHRWVGNDSKAFNLNIVQMESADTIEELAQIVHQVGMPNQNVMMVDSKGDIGWTVSGRIPKRKGEPALIAADWSQEEGWDGYLESDEVPKVLRPESGRLWTANNRIMGGEYLKKVGDGRFDPGARAKQIRDRLFEKESFSESDLLAIQLDDEARMMKVWQGWLRESIAGGSEVSPEISQEMRGYAEQEELRASTDSVAYRVVHEFRSQVLGRIFGVDVSRRGTVDSKKRGLAGRLGITRSFAISYEDVAEELIEQKPLHWLPAEYESWEALLADAAKQTQEELTKDQPLSQATWGKRNQAAIRHPLSRAVPALGVLLDMPAVELPGDSHLPRVQSPSAGASQRMVVSPGKEEFGIYHQPGGASGHPLSEYYRAGFDDWVQGNASRMLPGSTVHTIEIIPVR
jgi:penicillin amidase